MRSSLPLDQGLNFRESIRTGDLARVRQWLDQDPSLSQQLDPQQRTPLMLAASALQPELVELFLPLCNPLHLDKKGNQALHLVADWPATSLDEDESLVCAVQCLRLLLPVSDPLHQNHRGQTALMLAAHEHVDLMQVLLSVSDPLARDSRQWTALFFAADVGNADCVRLLLPHSNPLACDVTGQTPLLRACCSTAGDDTPATVQALLPVSDPSVVDAQGQTALMNAAGFSHDTLLPVLLPFCDPQARNQDGLRALEIAQKVVNPSSARGRSLRGLTLNRAWKCLDFLACLAPPRDTPFFSEEELSHLPRFQAQKERQGLEQAISFRTATLCNDSGSSPPSVPSNGLATEVSAGSLALTKRLRRL